MEEELTWQSMRCYKAGLAMQLPCQELSPKQQALAEERLTHASWRCFQATSLQMVKMLGPAAVYSLRQSLCMQSMADWYEMALANPNCSGAMTLVTHVLQLIRPHDKGNVCVQLPASQETSSIQLLRYRLQSKTFRVSKGHCVHISLQICRSCLSTFCWHASKNTLRTASCTIQVVVGHHKDEAKYPQGKIDKQGSMWQGKMVRDDA